MSHVPFFYQGMDHDTTTYIDSCFTVSANFAPSHPVGARVSVVRTSARLSRQDQSRYGPRRAAYDLKKLAGNKSSAASARPQDTKPFPKAPEP